MREELNENALDEVTGGTYKLNYNTRAVSFSTTGHAYFLADGCNLRTVQAAFDNYIGEFATMDQYDQACTQYLVDHNLIKSQIR